MRITLGSVDSGGRAVQKTELFFDVFDFVGSRGPFGPLHGAVCSVGGRAVWFGSREGGDMFARLDFCNRSDDDARATTVRVGIA